MKRWIFLSLLILGAPLNAQVILVDEALDESSGTRLEVRSVFDPMPPSGYAPLRIVATNGLERENVWRFDFTSQTQDYRRNNKAESTLNLPVSGRATQSASFLAPIAVDYGNPGFSGNSHSFLITLSSPRVKTFSHYGPRAAGFPAIAISKTLADGSLDGLNDEVGERQKAKSSWSGNNIFGSRFHPDHAPEDWLGFSGFDYVMLTDTDWQKLTPGARNALMQWVRLGGRLHFYHQSERPASLPADDLNYALGQIQSFAWDGRKLYAESTVARYWEGRSRLDDLVKEHALTADWPLLKALGARHFGSWQVVVFLVVFGVLVGPVNLFILAPSGRRHRLFITTPLLSLGASFLMVGIILFQDGVGGIGARYVFINLEPMDAAAYVTQKQTSRTGVLFGSVFDLSRESVIEPLALPDKEWVKLKSDNNSQPVNLTQAGTSRGGNFFQSRAEQAQMIRSAVSTRARLEVQPPASPDAAPMIVSALGFTLDEMFYSGSDGTLWKLTAPLATGQKASLVKVEMKQLRDWWDSRRKASEMEGLKALISHPQNHFFASAKAAPGFTQDTLDSIRWQQDEILVYGSVSPP